MRRSVLDARRSLSRSLRYANQANRLPMKRQTPSGDRCGAEARSLHARSLILLSISLGTSGPGNAQRVGAEGRQVAAQGRVLVDSRGPRRREG